MIEYFFKVFQNYEPKPAVLLPVKFLGNAVIKVVTGGTKTTLTLIIDIFNGPSNFWGAKLGWWNTTLWFWLRITIVSFIFSTYTCLLLSKSWERRVSEKKKNTYTLYCKDEGWIWATFSLGSKVFMVNSRTAYMIMLTTRSGKTVLRG